MSDDLKKPAHEKERHQSLQENAAAFDATGGKEKSRQMELLLYLDDGNALEDRDKGAFTHSAMQEIIMPGEKEKREIPYAGPTPDSNHNMAMTEPLFSKRKKFAFSENKFIILFTGLGAIGAIIEAFNPIIFDKDTKPDESVISRPIAETPEYKNAGPSAIPGLNDIGQIKEGKPPAAANAAVDTPKTRKPITILRTSRGKIVAPSSIKNPVFPALDVKVSLAQNGDDKFSDDYFDRTARILKTLNQHYYADSLKVWNFFSLNDIATAASLDKFSQAFLNKRAFVDKPEIKVRFSEKENHMELGPITIFFNADKTPRSLYLIFIHESRPKLADFRLE